MAIEDELETDVDESVEDEQVEAPEPEPESKSKKDKGEKAQSVPRTIYRCESCNHITRYPSADKHCPTCKKPLSKA